MSTNIDTSAEAVERLAIAADELWCDLLTLMGRASSEGHEAGQRLACEARQKVRYTGETLRALAAERDALRVREAECVVAANNAHKEAHRMSALLRTMEADRDAARAEVARLRETLEKARLRFAALRAGQPWATAAAGEAEAYAALAQEPGA